MNTLLLCIIVFASYIIAYFTYGRFLGKKIFGLSAARICPSRLLRDDIDFVPTDKNVLFGHHFTSIAGLGPIVGPAVAVIWGWLPAVCWVLFGAIFIGAVHDFGSLVVSLRHQGRSIGDLVADLLNPRVRLLFLVIILFLLWIVIAVFALVIALLFDMYPRSVIPIWIEVPVAVWVGHLIYKKKMSHTLPGIIGVVILYIFVVAGAYFPVDLKSFGLSANQAITAWMILLFIYAYIASTLPVQTLLQPRDYLNSHQLFIALFLLFAGVAVARPELVAPAFNPSPPGAPPLLPFIFVIIACGAISGFHSLVSSGTSSKQCFSETDARFVGYGSMLMEGALATLVICAAAGGIGLGLATPGGLLTSKAAFAGHYSSWAAASGLSAKIDAFVTGAANMIERLGIPHAITRNIMGVFIVSFAATTLDTATRLQRYIISELSRSLGSNLLARRHPATLLAVLSAFILAFYNGTGKGALVLWPLFGTVNQLLGGTALLVITIYLVKKQASAIYTFVPFLFMAAVTGWAMIENLVKFLHSGKIFLLCVGVIVFALELWMIIEAGIWAGQRIKRP